MAQSLERIIRSHEGLPPWFVQRAAGLAAAVGRVNVEGSAFGTGFLISPRHLLTCHHVISEPDVARHATLELDYHREENDAFGRVTTVRLAPDAVFAADEALDFALVALETPMEGRPAIPLTDQGDATVGERVTIFHHAQAGPLQLSLREGTVIAVQDAVLHHNASTQPGSAGAPLLDERLRLIGLHHASIPRPDVGPEGRQAAAGVQALYPAKEAIRATAILASLAKLAPDLFRQIGGSSAATVSALRSASNVAPAPAAAETVGSETPQSRDTVFISYAHADQDRRRWRERLRTFLAPLGGEADSWDDTRIQTGADWRREIGIALKRARVAVLLVGPNFLASDFIATEELPPLLGAAQTDGVAILPLITNHCSYALTSLGRYQAFNSPNEPLEAMSRADQNRWLRRFAEEIAAAFRGRRGG
jgi:hypothetical protein